MKWLIFVVVFIGALQLQAQEKTKEELEREKKFQEAAQKATEDTSKHYGWHHSVATGLNLSQIGFTDWVGGGENSLAFELWLRGASVRNEEQTLWMNSYKFAFGQARIGGLGLRKTSDEIYVEGLLIYKLGVYINPYVAATLRTQFAKGFSYDAQGNETAISKFFDPAYLTQSIGVAYKPVNEVTTRLGLAVREVLTSQFRQYADDPSTIEIEKTKIEGGLESITDVAWNFAENMAYAGKLEFFMPFDNLDRVIVRNDNIVTAKVSALISTTLELQFINDVNVSPRTQIKEMIAIGFMYTLL